MPRRSRWFVACHPQELRNLLCAGLGWADRSIPSQQHRQPPAGKQFSRSDRPLLESESVIADESKKMPGRRTASENVEESICIRRRDLRHLIQVYLHMSHVRDCWLHTERRYVFLSALALSQQN